MVRNISYSGRGVWVSHFITEGSMIEVERLRKSFNLLLAVDDISFTVGDGEIFGLLGPNGVDEALTRVASRIAPATRSRVSPAA